MRILPLVLFFIFSIFCQKQADQNCTPFGVRLALGRKFYHSEQAQIFSVRFNTRSQCSQSYLVVYSQKTKHVVICENSLLQINKYESFIHKCSIDFLKKGDKLEYMVYGWSGQKEEKPASFREKNISTSILKKDQYPLKVLVFGDWGDQNRFQRLDSAFNYLLSLADQPDLVYLNGDYAYDLSSNNGRNYEIFLKMLSQISPFWPCLFNIGNHQHTTPLDQKVFSSSFQNYDLAKNKITSLDLGTFTFLLSDPFYVMYRNSPKAQFLNLTNKHIKKARKSRPIIAATHYHMACAGGCLKEKQINQLINVFPQLFHNYIDNNVVLYIGSHVHSYERFLPYTKEGNFVKAQSPHIMTKQSKYLVSIVEGAAGNRQAMSKYKKKLNRTSSIWSQATGFGILVVNESSLNYSHYLAKDYKKPADSFIIQFSNILEEPKNIRQKIEQYLGSSAEI